MLEQAPWEVEVVVAVSKHLLASKLFSLGHAVLEVLEDLVLQLVLIALPGRP